MRPLPRNGALHELLLRAFVRDVLPLGGLHPWLRAAAGRALKLGLVEVAPPSPLALAAALDDLDASVVRLTQRGRDRLGVPAPSPLHDRDLLDVLRRAITFAYGHDRFVVSPDPTGRLIARTIGAEEAHGSLRWLADVVARFATEQGIPCRPARDERGVLLGFDRSEVSCG